MTVADVVVVGAGQAGIGVAAALREQGFAGRVTVVGREEHAPYERPPLSKSYLGATPVDERHLGLRAGGWYADRGIVLRLGEEVREIDRTAAVVVLGSGDRLPYDHLVLATGTRARTLPIEGGDLDGVVVLRGLDDARLLRRHLDRARTVLAVGAGFIGLEVAAAAHQRGVRPVVLDVASRVMERAVTSTTSRFFADAHRAQGTDLRLRTGVGALRGRHGLVTSAVTTDGAEIQADLVVVAVGVVPDTALARAAGLRTDDGVVVDAHLRTSDPAISAVGDCARFPEPVSGRSARLESVQAATDHARCVAARLAGRPEPYAAVPWFWTHQGPLKLQIAGLGGDLDREVVRGDPAQGRFSVFGFRDGRLATVESVGRPADHVAARRLLAAGAGPTPDQAADPAVDLKALAAVAP
ncbi:NAD(P)/FAD-dependent oxidoreductase [Pseudonocardia broussonetiae]|uniref:FAD-dependent oxidoreductase n=1 Tax=Pseudonocardia broussonetiae TaxID=2736640 RepID=A0A6M6JJ77_9PSEU|nr:FAD-dependent oxidoreductase [Pseudonocardia broussonetiae]QJY48108.1 FAD-dependent oxidoreductase [Pseudonocardia broussonetiae]